MIGPNFKKAAKPKRPSPLSVRLTAEERTRLEREAGSLSLNAYVRKRLFGDDAAPRRKTKPKPVKDYAELAKVLSALGRSELAPNVNALARGLENGTLEALPETDAAIRQACFDIACMRLMLIRALGKTGDTP